MEHLSFLGVILFLCVCMKTAERMLFSCNWVDLEMEIILLGQKHAVKHHSEYFNQHLGGVLLQPTEGFFQPSSICCSGQLTRLSMSPCQSVHNRGAGLCAHTEVPSGSFLSQDKYPFCLLASALPLGLKQTNCSSFSCTQIFQGKGCYFKQP